MSAKTDHDRDIIDFVPQYEFLRKLTSLELTRQIYDSEFRKMFPFSPKQNIEKIDLDPRKTIVLKCLEGIC